MARILLHDDTNTNPDAGIVLLSYQSCIVLLPRPVDKTSCRYAYETTPSLVPYYHRPNLPPKLSASDNRIVLSRRNLSLASYCCRRRYPHPIPRLSKLHDPSLAPYCHRMN